MDIIAHRGASHEAPENTLAAVRLAWEQDADAVEVDVQLSKDGRPVVIHDEDAKRTAGVAGKVSDQTLDRLRRLDVGRWKGEDWIGLKMRDASVVRGIGVLPVFAGVLGLLLLLSSVAATWLREGR